MKKEFVTLYGKAVIERDVLFLRPVYLPFEKTAFAQIGIELVWLLIFTIRSVSIESTKDIIITIAWGVIILFRSPAIYDKFFRRSYANRIAIPFIQ
jgi:hypothetical protein